VQELIGVILSAKADDEKKARSKANIDVSTPIFVIMDLLLQSNYFVTD
jgi:hypothetical protein